MMYDVIMGVIKEALKLMEKIHMYMKTCMFCCFHVNFKHENTKTCMFPCKFAYLI